MGNGRYNKKVMAAVRIALFVGGFLLGAALAALFFEYKPDLVGDPLKIVFIVSCGLVLGLTLLLSARPIVSLVAAIGVALKKLFTGKSPEQIAGFFLGISLGAMVTFVAYVILRVVLPIRPLVVALTIIAALLFCFLGALVCSRWLCGGAEEAEEEGEREESASGGYVMTAAAFFTDKAEELVGNWLQGKAFVLARSVELFAEGDGEAAVVALKVYRSLVQSGKLKTVNYDKGKDETECVKKYAKLKRLAVITADEEEQSKYADSVKALNLSSL